MHSHAFVPAHYLSVFAAFERRQVIPADCKMLWAYRPEARSSVANGARVELCPLGAELTEVNAPASGLRNR